MVLLSTRDPAVEAAQRATDGRVSHLIGPGRYALRGAREALAPIRELHRREEIGATSCVEDCEAHEDECPLDVEVAVCRECFRIAEEADAYFFERTGWQEPVEWPCATARLIYTDDELTGGEV